MGQTSSFFQRATKIRELSMAVNSATAQSTDAFTVMLLFLVFGSGVDENALPVSVSVLPAPTESLSVMVTVTLAPFARLPILQLKVPAVPTTGAVQVPALVVKPAKVVPTGVA